MGDLQSVQSACVLRDNALDIRVSDEIAKLEDAIADIESGTQFFEKTHITHGLQILMSEGLARLAGQSSQGIFHLKQAMGGGKTHLLTSIGLLAKHPSLRQSVCPDLAVRFDFGSAKIAVFNGRNTPKEYFWGVIAHQLGNGELFRKHWIDGPKAPDEAAWLELFSDNQPTLILLDEIPPYFDVHIQRTLGSGTMADELKFGLATLLTAASKKSNVCVVVSDLAASYEGGGKLINKALDDVRQEVGRQERSITPVDLTGNEIYNILRKRLFAKLPDTEVIQSIAEAYSLALTDASKSKTIPRTAEALTEEVLNTYPFHPRLKNMIALFKNNDRFRQTRGLMEFISRLLKSVWQSDEAVYLIGPQHFDFSIPDVRDAFERIGSLRDIMSSDIWDTNQSAHAQILDANSGNHYASQISSLILTASISDAVNAVKGLTRSEIMTCMITPLNDTNAISTSLDSLQKESWHMHTTPDGKYYFDPQENLGKMLQRDAQNAPDGQIDTIKKDELEKLFKPNSRSVYQKVLALPSLDEVKDIIKRERVLILVEPESKLPPEKVNQFFNTLIQKNNLCVLTGATTEMAKLDSAARQMFAIEKAEKRMDNNHPQYAELQKRKESAVQEFFTNVCTLFDTLYRPVLINNVAELRAEKLDTTRDTKQPFSGEQQIEKTLSSDGVAKLFIAIESNYAAIRGKAELLLWDTGSSQARWSDIMDRAAQNAGFFWLAPNGLETVKRLAIEKGEWEESGDGWVSKSPEKKKTSVQIITYKEMDNNGVIELHITPMYAGPKPRIYCSTSQPVISPDNLLIDTKLSTSELCLYFAVEDTTGHFDTGPDKKWENKLKIVCSDELDINGKRHIELTVLPKGTIRYTLDGSEARNGIQYTGPIAIGDESVRVLTFAEADGLETKDYFDFAEVSDTDDDSDGAAPIKAVSLNMSQPATLAKELNFNGSGPFWKAFESAQANHATLFNTSILIGQGNRSVTMRFMPELPMNPALLAAIIKPLQNSIKDGSEPSITIRRMEFPSGQDLLMFVEANDLAIKPHEIKQ